MNKYLISCLLFLFAIHAQAQDKDFYGVANHASIGVGIGVLSGGTVELAVPVTRYAAIRAGYNFFPKINVKADLNLRYGAGSVNYFSYLPHQVKVEGKPELSTGHILVDLYPIKNSSFHFTAGAYLGKENLADIQNPDDDNAMIFREVYQFNQRQGIYTGIPDDLGGLVGTNVDGREKIGMMLGKYFLEPDANGQVNAKIAVKKFRPYVGFGFGRAVPEKNRFALNFDMGVQFWGTPSVTIRDHELSEQDVKGKDGGALKTLSKVTLCPVISLRLMGRVL